MIYILDDDAEVRDSLRLLLECEGFEAREFVSSRAFLDAVQPGETDCLILDVHMPGMSGLELLETLRRFGSECPAIVITGQLSASTESRAWAAGALAVIEKPYRADELLDLVRRALQGDAGLRP
jgi:FixJ family two-component response regulator